MAVNQTLAWKQWTRIISRWPVDKVRPEAVSFQTLMKKRLNKYENPRQTIQSDKVQGNEANVQPVNLTWNENKEMRQVNALYALLENRFQHDSRLPEQMRFPASNPDHYDNVIAESERAPSRGLFTRISDRLRGMIRLT